MIHHHLLKLKMVTSLGLRLKESISSFSRMKITRQIFASREFHMVMRMRMC